MKVYWIYTCDYGHEWTILRDEKAQAVPEDRICPFGHESVTLQKWRPIDLVQIMLKPAAVLVDTFTNQIQYEKEYWLILSDIEDIEKLVSSRPYLWREVLSLAEKFQGRSKASAWELWGKIKP
jgi:hypothetical protein